MTTMNKSQGPMIHQFLLQTIAVVRSLLHLSASLLVRLQASALPLSSS